MSDIKVHILSDLHLEFGRSTPAYLSTLDVDMLVLAGDIGNFTDEKHYAKFIGFCAERFKYVLIVAGNHEYYGKQYSIGEVERKINEIVSRHPNTHFLQRNCTIINGVRFIGCTLWSLPKTDRPLINDFTQIKYVSGVSVYKQLFYTDLKYLTEELNKPFSGKTVVITHHLPSYELVPDEYKGDPTSGFFATDLEYLLPLVNYWFCGHTHHAAQKEINGCTCIVNPYGYPDEKGKTGFSELVVSIPTDRLID